MNNGTKTELSRVVPINGELRELLDSISHRQGYVFLNKSHKPISQPTLNGIWRSLLQSMSLRYRVPDQLRHTMISYHANNDYPIHKLAANSRYSGSRISKVHLLRLYNLSFE